MIKQRLASIMSLTGALVFATSAGAQTGAPLHMGAAEATKRPCVGFENLVAWWPIRSTDTGSSVADYSGKGNTMFKFGAGNPPLILSNEGFGPGHYLLPAVAIGGAPAFMRTTSATIMNGVTEGTMMMWIYMTATQKNWWALDSHDNANPSWRFGFFSYVIGYIRNEFGRWGGSGDPKDFAPGAWVHWVLTVTPVSGGNGTRTKVTYKNGVALLPTYTATGYPDTLTVTHPWTLGSSYGGIYSCGSAFRLDDVRLYNRCLSAAEVAEAYREGRL